MAKRKIEASSEAKTSNDRQSDGDASSDENDDGTLNVEFEWFDPQPKYDFEGIKVLLKQLLGNDAIDFDLSGITDLILSQPLLGSTIKVEGNESDPFAFLQIINLQEHSDNIGLQLLKKYISEKSADSAKLSQIATLLSPGQSSQVGLILTERLLNIPPQVIPPMYKMLQEELDWAIQEAEPYKFTHYLILSKKYVEVESALDQEDNPQGKRAKKSPGTGNLETFYFHPEDEILERLSSTHGTFEYTRKEPDGASDSRRAFQEAGIRPIGSMMLLEGSKFKQAIAELEKFVNS